ncbi:hypothetical protein RBA71_12030 [Brenneria goodwinii]|uniref:hypothetical protein n=1 Tax=Brenneria goodwinii TaxID=1109412 RepID=UPI0036E7E39D
MFLMITDWIGYLSNQVDKVCREVCVAKADAFFFNQQTAAKLPLRTQQPLVSIQTRLIGDEGYHRFGELDAVLILYRKNLKSP